MTVLSVDLAAERLLVDGDPVEISSTAAPLLLPFFSEPSFWSPADPSFRSRLLKLEVANFEDCKTQSMEEMRKLSKWLSVLQNLLRIHWRKIVSEICYNFGLCHATENNCCKCFWMIVAYMLLVGLVSGVQRAP